MVETRPTILVPYFSRRESNEVYAQNLDSDSIIESFVPFLPDRYRQVNVAMVELDREVGEEGVIAIVWPDESLTIGSPRELGEACWGAADPEVLPAFFALEVAALSGDTDSLAAARERASKLLGPFCNEWLETEDAIALPNRASAAARAGQTKDPTVAEMIGRLRQYPSDQRIWPSQWLTAWSEYGQNRSELGEMAGWWLRGRFADEISQAIVLNRLIRDQEWPPGFFELATDWLSTVSIGNYLWPEVWLGLTASAGVPLPLREAGMEYLSSSLAAPHPYPTAQKMERWSRVWKRLWQGTRLSEELENLAREVPETYYLGTHFASDVLFTLAQRDPSSEWVTDALREWLIRQEEGATYWVNIFFYLLEQHPEDAELIRTGLKWIEYSGTNVSAWVFVWRRLSPHLNGRRAWEIAVSWLGRTDPVLNVWPDVLATVLRVREPPADHPLGAFAVAWLKLNKPHHERVRIAAFAEAHLGSGVSRRQSTTGGDTLRSEDRLPLRE